MPARYWIMYVVLAFFAGGYCGYSLTKNDSRRIVEVPECCPSHRVDFAELTQTCEIDVYVPIVSSIEENRIVDGTAIGGAIQCCRFNGRVFDRCDGSDAASLNRKAIDAALRLRNNAWPIQCTGSLKQGDVAK